MWRRFPATPGCVDARIPPYVSAHSRPVNARVLPTFPRTPGWLIPASLCEKRHGNKPCDPRLLSGAAEGYPAVLHYSNWLGHPNESTTGVGQSDQPLSAQQSEFLGRSFKSEAETERFLIDAAVDDAGCQPMAGKYHGHERGGR